MAPEGKRIVVAIDESEDSKQAFAHALALARPDDSVVALYVREPAKETADEPKSMAHSPLYLQEAIQKVEVEAENRIKAMIEELEKQATEQGVSKFSSVIVKGDPREKICEYSEQTIVDLMVIGSRGRGALKRMMLGSVSDFVVHHCNCPVLVVRNRSKDAENRRQLLNTEHSPHFVSLKTLAAASF